MEHNSFQQVNITEKKHKIDYVDWNDENDKVKTRGTVKLSSPQVAGKKWVIKFLKHITRVRPIITHSIKFKKIPLTWAKQTCRNPHIYLGFRKETVNLEIDSVPLTLLRWVPPNCLAPPRTSTIESKSSMWTSSYSGYTKAKVA